MTDVKRNPGQIAFTLLLLLGVLLVIGISFSLSSTARTFPLIVAIPAGILLLFQLRYDIWPGIGKGMPFFREQAVVELQLPDELTKATEAQSLDGRGDDAMSEWLVFVWLAGITAAVYFVHYLIAAPIFTLAFLRLQAKNCWKTSLIVTVVTTVILYLLLYRLLRIDYL